MGSNKIVLISVVGIAGVAIVNAVKNHQGITRIVAGAYVLLLLLSLLDLFGGVWSQIAGGIAMLALISVVLTQFPLGALQAVTGTTPNVPSGTVRPPSNTLGPQQ